MSARGSYPDSGSDRGVETPPRALEILAFWFGGEEKLEDAESRGVWFKRDDEFDAEIERRFAPDHEKAAAGELDGWLETPGGALALVILLDQFPRNLFRGSPRALQRIPKPATPPGRRSHAASTSESLRWSGGSSTCRSSTARNRRISVSQ